MFAITKVAIVEMDENYVDTSYIKISLIVLTTEICYPLTMPIKERLYY